MICVMRDELYVIEGFFNGGIEISLYNLLKQYDYGVNRVTVLSMVGGPLLQKFKELPITIICLCEEEKAFRGKHRLVNLSIKYLPPRFLHFLYLRGMNFDTEIAYHNGQPAVIVSGAPSKTKKVAWFHMGFPLEATVNNIDNYLSSGEKAINCYECFDELVCVSHGQRKTLLKLFEMAGADFSSKISVRHNIIDYDRIERLSQEKCEIYNPGILIVACGRLSVEKGFDRIVEMARYLVAVKDDFCILIIGGGEEQNRLREMVRDYGINDYVKFLGFQENPYKFFKKADYVICPSRYESFGLVVAEALALGKCVIASKCEGTVELLMGVQNSYLIENDDTHFPEQAARIIISGK